MTVGIFALVNPYQIVSKSGAIVQIYRITPKVTPGKIKPNHGLSALLRNICKINVPSHTKNTAAMPTNRKAGRKNTVYFTPNNIQSITVAAIFPAVFSGAVCDNTGKLKTLPPAKVHLYTT